MHFFHILPHFVWINCEKSKQQQSHFCPLIHFHSISLTLLWVPLCFFYDTFLGWYQNRNGTFLCFVSAVCFPPSSVGAVCAGGLVSQLSPLNSHTRLSFSPPLLFIPPRMLSVFVHHVTCRTFNGGAKPNRISPSSIWGGGGFALGAVFGVHVSTSGFCWLLGMSSVFRLVEPSNRAFSLTAPRWPATQHHKQDIRRVRQAAAEGASRLGGISLLSGIPGITRGMAQSLWEEIPKTLNLSEGVKVPHKERALKHFHFRLPGRLEHVAAEWLPL